MANMKLWRWVVISAVVAIVAIPSVAAEEPPVQEVGVQTDETETVEKVPYAWKFAEHQSYDVRVVVISETSEVSGRRGWPSTFGLAYRLDVNSVDDQGNALIDCVVTRVKYSQKGLEGGGT